MHGTASTIDKLAAEFLSTREVGRAGREDVLADFVREKFALGPFPHDRDLFRVLRELEVRTDALPLGTQMHGANFSYPETGTAILLRDDVSRARQETTLCHELREVMENAFARVDPTYKAIDTHNNKLMNPISDRFAAALLMQTKPSQELLETNGWDPIDFSNRTGRSLSSVVVRMQALFPAGCVLRAPVAGYWLYERPSGFSQRPDDRESLVVRQVAVLNGFSLASTTPASRAVASFLPKRWAHVTSSPDALGALQAGRATLRMTPSLDLFGDQQYLILAEPVMRGSSASKVLLAAVRRDCLDLIFPWLDRTDLFFDSVFAS